jgi:integrase
MAKYRKTRTKQPTRPADGWKVRNVQLDSGSYYLRLYEVSRRRKIKLGRADEFESKEALEAAAEEIRLKHHKVKARNVTFKQFCRWFYLPVAKAHVRRATYDGYLTIYNVHIKPRPEADSRLWEFSTVEVQTLLHAIAAAKSLTGMTLRHIKAFLSGVFRQSIEMGYFRGANPVHEARLPWKARPSADTYAYTMDEIHAALPRLQLPARAAFAIAAFAGLRRSEIQGLEWTDVEGDRLWVRRSVVRGRENEPKSKASRAWVPIIPPLRAVLDEYQPEDATGRLFPVSLGYIAKRQFKKAGLLHGFHAARRGLASNLFDLGIDDLTVSRILRHSGVQVTRQHYIQLRDARVDDAMGRLQTRWDGIRTNAAAGTS